MREPLLEAVFTTDCHDALESAGKLCTDLGYELVEARPVIERRRFATAFARMLCAEVATELRQAAVILKRRVRREEFEAITWALGLLGRAIPAVELLQAQRDINEIAREFAAWTAGFDIIMTPTLAQPPPLIGALLPGGIDALVLAALGRLHAGRVLRALGMVEQLAADAFAFIPTTPLFNMNGQPAMSVPLHWNADGLPIGMHFSAALGDEARLLRLAAELENAAPWAARRPPTS